MLNFAVAESAWRSTFTPYDGSLVLLTSRPRLVDFVFLRVAPENLKFQVCSISEPICVLLILIYTGFELSHIIEKSRLTIFSRLSAKCAHRKTLYKFCTRCQRYTAFYEDTTPFYLRLFINFSSLFRITLVPTSPSK